jgi:hypothetical protein
MRIDNIIDIINNKNAHARQNETDSIGYMHTGLGNVTVPEGHSSIYVKSQYRPRYFKS